MGFVMEMHGKQWKDIAVGIHGIPNRYSVEAAFQGQGVAGRDWISTPDNLEGNKVIRRLRQDPTLSTQRLDYFHKILFGLMRQL